MLRDRAVLGLRNGDEQQRQDRQRGRDDVDHASTLCSGRKLSSSAPSGGATMLIRPCRPWFSPLMRASCSLGHEQRGGRLHRREMERAERRARAAWRRRRARPACCRVAYRTISPTVVTATRPSAAIMTRRRFQRSTSAPANGLMKTCGRIANRVAVARTVADFVVLVSHHTRANWTSWLPSSENACPAQMVKKRRAQLGGPVVVRYCGLVIAVSFAPVLTRQIVTPTSIMSIQIFHIIEVKREKDTRKRVGREKETRGRRLTPASTQTLASHTWLRMELRVQL